MGRGGTQFSRPRQALQLLRVPAGSLPSRKRQLLTWVLVICRFCLAHSPMPDLWVVLPGSSRVCCGDIHLCNRNLYWRQPEPGGQTLEPPDPRDGLSVVQAPFRPPGQDRSPQSSDGRASQAVTAKMGAELGQPDLWANAEVGGGEGHSPTLCGCIWQGRDRALSGV